MSKLFSRSTFRWLIALSLAALVGGATPQAAKKAHRAHLDNKVASALAHASDKTKVKVIVQTTGSARKALQVLFRNTGYKVRREHKLISALSLEVTEKELAKLQEH